MAGGEVTRGVALLALSIVAIALVTRDPRLMPFLGCFWIYQALDARHVYPALAAVAPPAARVAA